MMVHMSQALVLDVIEKKDDGRGQTRLYFGPADRRCPPLDPETRAVEQTNKAADTDNVVVLPNRRLHTGQHLAVDVVLVEFQSTGYQSRRVPTDSRHSRFAVSRLYA